MKRKRRERKKVTKEKAALLVIIGFFIFIVGFSYVNQINESKAIPAEEYFEISGVITGGEIDDEGGLLIEELYFNITAVKGDAHEVWVNTAGVGGTEEVDMGTMVKDKPYWVNLDFIKTDAGIFRIRPSQGGQFTLRLQITSLEAWGTINVVVPPPH